MGTSVITVEREATDVDLTLTVSSNGGVAGLTAIVEIRDGSTTSSYLDFSDNTFKTSAWTTKSAPMADIGGGHYRYSLNLSVMTNLPATTTQLVAEYVTAGDIIETTHDKLQIVESFLNVPADVVAGIGGAGSDVYSPNLQVRKSLPFVNINIITTNLEGVRITPDSNPIARIYRVEAKVEGALALDTALGTLGEVTLLQLVGQQGWYGAGLDLTSAAFEQYEIIVEYFVNTIAIQQKLSLQVSAELEAINSTAASNVTVASVGTTFKAPSPDGS